MVLNRDTIHLFVNHWPSRWGGQAATEPKRMFVAEVLRNIADSILTVNPLSNVLIMGDFNDEPQDKSVADTLNALCPVNMKGQVISGEKFPLVEIESTSLYNLMLEMKSKGQGSLVYKDAIGYNWNMLDQIVVSGALLSGNGKLKVKNYKAEIFQSGFLMEEKENGIIVPFRTFSGPRYLGGFSDHLPVYVDIYLRK